MASVGGPFQSVNGPVERAGVMNFVGRARAEQMETQSCRLCESTYRGGVIESTAANMAQHFAELLVQVERGETIRIHKQGRTVARMVPDFDFMPGRQAAALFKGHRADTEAANAIAAELRKLDLEAEHALDH